MPVAGIQTKMHDGRAVTYKGIKFEGSPRVVFWRFFQPYLNGWLKSSIEWLLEQCRSRHLEPHEYIEELSGLLKVLIRWTFEEMADTDQLLRGQGNPASATRTDVASRIESTTRHLDDLIAAYLLDGRARSPVAPPTLTTTGKRMTSQILKGFIASSMEGRPAAAAFKRRLEAEQFEMTVWDEDVFAPGTYTIPALIAAIKEHRFDFAVLIFSLDDAIVSRDIHAWAPRDNVLIEAGLFMNEFDGPERAFIAIDKQRDAKIASDLKGITFVDYDGSRKPLDSAVRVACDRIAQQVRKLGPRPMLAPAVSNDRAAGETATLLREAQARITLLEARLAQSAAPRAVPDAGTWTTWRIQNNTNSFIGKDRVIEFHQRGSRVLRLDYGALDLLGQMVFDAYVRLGLDFAKEDGLAAEKSVWRVQTRGDDVSVHEWLLGSPSESVSVVRPLMAMNSQQQKAVTEFMELVGASR